MRVRVEIKAKHIEEAGDGANNCVLAQALAEVVGGEVIVGSEQWYLTSCGHRVGNNHQLSASARRIVSRFDNGATIKPCAIFLDIPEEVLHAHNG